MNIVHIAPNAPYNEGWGYQENLLTKYQAKAGHQVSLIIKNEKFQDGEIIKTSCEDYFSPDGFRVIRKETIPGVVSVIGEKMQIYNLLCELKPDYIFHHGLVSLTIQDAVKYKKKNNPNCIIVQDNHLDYNIGMNADTVKQKILRMYYRLIFRKTRKYIFKVYGVTPWRKTYAEDYFKVPPSMTDVLIMGADDEKIDFKNREHIRTVIRGKYEIKNEDFLIVTGGKIDEKKNIHRLMEAVSSICGVKLLIFGEVSNSLKERFEELVKKKNILYIGWIPADNVYDYFFAADLVFFPGQHSVLWEQACASKVPCVFKKWPGMDHVNNGGNADFIEDVSVKSIIHKLEALRFTNKYFEMKQIAESESTDVFLYSKIASKSLEEMRSVSI